MYPRGGEARAALAWCSEQPGTTWGLTADVSKAHRRVKHLEQDWGLLACKLDESDTVWLNTVGTFWVGCASYWWSRLLAVPARLAIGPAQKDPSFQLVFSDDVSWFGKGRSGIRAIVVSLFVLCIFGTPLSWPKVGGGGQLRLDRPGNRPRRAPHRDLAVARRVALFLDKAGPKGRSSSSS